MLDLDHIRAALARHTPDTRASALSKRQAAVGLVLRDAPGGALEALFIRRAEHEHDPWSGHMALPGGRKDPEDPSLAAAAMREIFEEVGLMVGEEMLLGRLDDIKAGLLEVYDLSVSPFVFYYPNAGALTLNHEVAEAPWLPLAHFANTQNVTPYILHWNDAERVFPAFEVGSYRIWGLTYRVLRAFFGLLEITLPAELPHEVPT
jgi:8-oxo-dGTP pyrophosphatase MutT (NUDIX family)